MRSVRPQSERESDAQDETTVRGPCPDALTARATGRAQLRFSSSSRRLSRARL